jgi:hypothetical protein
VETHVQFAIRFGKVERSTVTFRKRTDQKDQEAQGLIDYIIEVPRLLLLFDDGLEALAAGDHQQGDDRQAHGQFVRDDLRGAPDSGQERKFVIGSPPADHDPINAHAHDPEDVKDADIDIRDL